MPVPPGLKRHQDNWHFAVATVHHRRIHDTPTKRRMMDVAERYNHSVFYALPEVEGEPSFPPLAGAIIADAIDSHSTKANDTEPVVTAPAVNPDSAGSRKKARLRSHAWSAAWHENQLLLKLGRAYRQYFGYATFCLSVSPNHRDKRPMIETRDPLLAYPEPMNNDEVRRPENIGFVYGMSPTRLTRLYPDIAGWVKDNTTSDDDLWDVLDWYDTEWRYTGILGKRGAESFQRRYDAQGHYILESDQPLAQALLLRAFPNRVGHVPMVCPQQMSLDRQISAITRIVPITDLMNKVAAMEFISAEKTIWPYIFALGEDGNAPEILGGELVDGRTGEINEVTNTRDIQTLQTGPAPQTQVLMANMERAARLATGNPSTQQGEMSPSVRSGQTINQMNATAIDPRLKEAHRTMSYALKEINESVAATEEAYWPRRSYTVFSGWAGANRHITYQPSKIWGDSKEGVVQYPLPGMDAQASNIILEQLVSSRMVSRRTARMHHPLVAQMDPESQDRQIMEEAAEDAISMAVLQQVGQGGMAMTDLVAWRKKMRAGMDPEEALEEVQTEAQERQAAEAPPPEAGMAAPPEAMPGINDPEAGGQMPLPPEAGAEPGGQGGGFDELAAAMMAAPPGAA